MIQLDNICLQAGNFTLKDVSFIVPTGAYAMMMGRTGCGKTTILEAICGLRRVQSGTIKLMARDVTRLKAAERGIGYVPQDGALFPTMTVYDHLAFALQLRRWKKNKIDLRVKELAELLGIAPLLQRKPLGLSGGEKQRVAFGRALAFYPSILCLDEPLSALDFETREEMCQLLETIKTTQNVTTIHITHDPTEAKRLADCMFRFEAGKVIPLDEEVFAKLGY